MVVHHTPFPKSRKVSAGLKTDVTNHIVSIRVSIMQKKKTFSITFQIARTPHLYICPLGSKTIEQEVVLLFTF